MPVPLSEATIFRFVDAGGAHVYSKNGDPNSQANYTLEGPAFQVYTQNYPGTVALNRCTQGNLHFLSAEPTCEASTVAGVLGYISSNQVGGTVPLYRFNNANWVHTLESLNLGEGAGYTTTTTLGFVPAQ